MPLGAHNVPVEVLQIVLDNLYDAIDENPFPPQQVCTRLMRVNKHWSGAVRDHRLYTAINCNITHRNFVWLCKWLRRRRDEGRIIDSAILIFQSPAEYGAFAYFLDIFLPDLSFNSLHLPWPDEDEPSNYSVRPMQLPYTLTVKDLTIDDNYCFHEDWMQFEGEGDLDIFDNLKRFTLNACHYRCRPLIYGHTDNLVALDFTYNFEFHRPRDPPVQTDTCLYEIIEYFPKLKELSLQLPHENPFRAPSFARSSSLYSRYSQYDGCVWLPPLARLKVLLSDVVVAGLQDCCPNLKVLDYTLTTGMQIRGDDCLPDHLKSISITFVEDQRNRRRRRICQKERSHQGRLCHRSGLSGFIRRRIDRQPPRNGPQCQFCFSYISYRHIYPPEPTSDCPSCTLESDSGDSTDASEDEIETGLISENDDDSDEDEDEEKDEDYDDVIHRYMHTDIANEVLGETHPLFDRDMLYKFDKLRVFALRGRSLRKFATLFNSGFYNDALPKLKTLSVRKCRLVPEAVERFKATHPGCNVVYSRRTRKTRQGREGLEG